MFYILLSIICSVTVGIIFKVARRYTISVSQIVTWNYVTALLLCYIFFAPDVSVINAESPWQFLLPLSLLLPCIFLFLAASIKYMGIVKTDASQRLSLFIPVLAAYFIFGESFNTYKIAGLLIAFPAIILLLLKPVDNIDNKWLYPAIVLLGFGVIDVLFKQIVLNNALPYTTSLFVVFCGALLVAAIIAIADIISSKSKFASVNILAGLLVGLFNFGNILFYLKAHKAFANNPSTVFAAMNIGVIILGSIAGIFIFKERLSKYNYAGLALALLGIVLITISQIYI